MQTLRFSPCTGLPLLSVRLLPAPCDRAILIWLPLFDVAERSNGYACRVCVRVWVVNPEWWGLVVGRDENVHVEIITDVAEVKWVCAWVRVCVRVVVDQNGGTGG